MLKVDSIDVHYGKLQALKKVSFEVLEGEIVGLIGANGAGKTTTLRTISGFSVPTSGNVKFLDKEINGFPPHNIVKMGISHCPEGRRVFPGMTVSENLIKMGAYSIKKREQTMKNLEEVHELFPLLKDRKNQLAGTLSGGEQQMLAIGRALMSRPKLLMLDEPSLGLAPNMVMILAKLIKRIHKKGTTVLLVEQNANMALSISDRAYVLEVGKIALKGKGKELLKDEHVRKAYLGL